MQLGPLLDILAGCALAAVGVIALRRGLRALGWALIATAITWFAGSVWPAAALAHRVPLVIALTSAAAWTSRRTEALVMVGIAAVAALSAVQPAAWTALSLGVAVAAASHVALRRVSTIEAASAGLVFGYALVILVVIYEAGAAADLISAAYSVTMLVVATLLLRRCTMPLTLGTVVRLAAADTDQLTGRLRLLLNDPRLDLAFGEAVPASASGTAVVTLRRGGERVGTLRFSREHPPEAQLVDALEILAGLLADARALRARSLATFADLDVAQQDFLMARARSSATIGEKLRSGPLQHLSRAREKIADPTLLGELDAARAQLASISRDLANPAGVVGDWRSALAQHIALSPIPVVADLPSDLADVPDQIGREALLGCLETLSNAAKHSSATSIRVAASIVDRTLHVRVADDGFGGAGEHGFGLRGIRERVERLGGGFALDSRAGEGTVVHFWLPCEVK